MFKKSRFFYSFFLNIFKNFKIRPRPFCREFNFVQFKKKLEKKLFDNLSGLRFLIFWLIFSKNQKISRNIEFHGSRPCQNERKLNFNLEMKKKKKFGHYLPFLQNFDFYKGLIGKIVSFRNLWSKNFFFPSDVL